MPEMTNFEYEAHAMTEKGNYLNLLKPGSEKFVKSNHVNLFWAGLCHLEPQ